MFLQVCTESSWSRHMVRHNNLSLTRMMSHTALLKHDFISLNNSYLIIYDSVMSALVTNTYFCSFIGNFIRHK